MEQKLNDRPQGTEIYSKGSKNAGTNRVVFDILSYFVIFTHYSYVFNPTWV